MGGDEMSVFIEIKTTTGITVIDVEHISAITQVDSTGLFNRNKYDLGIHMVSGTIFTSPNVNVENIDKIFEAWQGGGKSLKVRD
tara:strand:- start:50 stop:301 length:252 start_codon:yes stop_codon:yes gene_type:complete